MPVVITAPVHLIDYPVKVGAVARAPPGPGGVEPGEMRRRTIPTAATKIARISLSFLYPWKAPTERFHIWRLATACCDLENRRRRRAFVRRSASPITPYRDDNAIDRNLRVATRTARG